MVPFSDSSSGSLKILRIKRLIFWILEAYIKGLTIMLIYDIDKANTRTVPFSPFVQSNVSVRAIIMYTAAKSNIISK